MSKPDTDSILAVASGMIQEIRQADLDRMPGMVIHTAYYAAFHSARALLHETHGTVSTKHGTVHTAFESLAKTDSQDMLRLAIDLRTLYEARLLQDYLGSVPTRERAESAAAIAKSLFAFAAQRLGMPTDIP